MEVRNLHAVTILKQDGRSSCSFELSQDLGNMSNECNNIVSHI